MTVPNPNPNQSLNNASGPARAGWFARFVHWMRGLFRRGPRDGSGTPPNIYPLY